MDAEVGILTHGSCPSRGRGVEVEVEEHPFACCKQLVATQRIFAVNFRDPTTTEVGF